MITLILIINLLKNKIKSIINDKLSVLNKLDLGSHKNIMEKHSLKEIIGLLKNRKISQKELLQYYFSRIKKFNPILNALVSLRSMDDVFIDLENLKNHYVQKKTKNLFGIPLAVKDLIDVEGLPTTYGVPKYKNNIAKKNSIIVLFLPQLK